VGRWQRGDGQNLAMGGGGGCVGEGRGSEGRGGGRAMGGGEGSGMLVVVRWFASRWYGVSLIM